MHHIKSFLYIMSVNTKTNFPLHNLDCKIIVKSVYNAGHKLKHFGHNSCRVTNRSILWSQIVPQSQIEASHKSCRHTSRHAV